MEVDHSIYCAGFNGQVCVCLGNAFLGHVELAIHIYVWLVILMIACRHLLEGV